MDVPLSKCWKSMPLARVTSTNQGRPGVGFKIGRALSIVGVGEAGELASCQANQAPPRIKTAAPRYRGSRRQERGRFMALSLEGGDVRRRARVDPACHSNPPEPGGRR